MSEAISDRHVIMSRGELDAVQTALASACFLLNKHVPGHAWTPQIEKALDLVKAKGDVMPKRDLGSAR